MVPGSSNVKDYLFSTLLHVSCECLRVCHVTSALAPMSVGNQLAAATLMPDRFWFFCGCILWHSQNASISHSACLDPRRLASLWVTVSLVTSPFLVISLPWLWALRPELDTWYTHSGTYLKWWYMNQMVIVYHIDHAPARTSQENTVPARSACIWF